MPINSKVYDFKAKDKKGQPVNCGMMEIKSKDGGIPSLYFYGDITASSFDNWQEEDRCPQDVADFLNQLNGASKFDIFINSGGGSTFAGQAIYAQLMRNDAEKTVYIDGLAASAASIIAMAGDRIIIPSTAQLMIHNAWTIAMGNSNDFRKMADTLDKANESMLNVYKTKVVEGVTPEQIKQMMDAETWLNGEAASKVFNVEVSDMQIAACADSQYFKLYKNLPDSLKSMDECEYATKSYIDSKISEVIQAIASSKPLKSEDVPPPDPRHEGNGDDIENKIEIAKAKLKLACEI